MTHQVYSKLYYKEYEILKDVQVPKYKIHVLFFLRKQGTNIKL